MEYISAVVHGFVAHSIATPLLGSLCQTPTHDDGTLVSANITSPVLSPETQKNFLKSKLFPGKTPNNSTSSSGHTNLRVLPASKHFYMKSRVCVCVCMRPSKIARTYTQVQVFNPGTQLQRPSLAIQRRKRLRDTGLSFSCGGL